MDRSFNTTYLLEYIASFRPIKRIALVADLSSTHTNARKPEFLVSGARELARGCVREILDRHPSGRQE